MLVSTDIWKGDWSVLSNSSLTPNESIIDDSVELLNPINPLFESKACMNTSTLSILLLDGFFNIPKIVCVVIALSLFWGLKIVVLETTKSPVLLSFVIAYVDIGRNDTPIAQLKVRVRLNLQFHTLKYNLFC